MYYTYKYTDFIAFGVSFCLCNGNTSTKVWTQTRENHLHTIEFRLSASVLLIALSYELMEKW